LARCRNQDDGARFEIGVVSAVTERFFSDLVECGARSASARRSRSRFRSVVRN